MNEMSKEEYKEFYEKQKALHDKFISALGTQQTVLHKSRVDVYSFLTDGVLYEVHVETEHYDKMRRELDWKQKPVVVGVWHIQSALQRPERITDPEELVGIANDLMYELFESYTPTYVVNDFSGEDDLQNDDDDGSNPDAADEEKEMRFLNND